LHEIEQQIEDLRFERHQCAIAPELAAIRVECATSEKDKQIQLRAAPEARTRTHSLER
jgi:hypothetical protein